MKTSRESRKNAHRALFCVGMLLVLAWLPILPGSSAWAAGGASGQLAVSRTVNGYEVAGRFLKEWSRQGSDRDSIYVNGLPITPRRSEISLTDGLPYDTQWFERARYELHPQNRPPYDVLLGLLGVSLTEGRGVVDPGTGKVHDPADQAFVGIERPPDADGAGKVWFGETKHTVGGKILEYWKRYGGLRQFGFPLSEPFEEQSEADGEANGKVYQVQYFERNRFELHPEKVAPYEVELGLLGVQQYRATAVPAEELPIAPPRGVKSSKDTLTILLSYRPTDLFRPYQPASYSVAQTPAAPIFNSVVGSDGYGRLWPELAWYVPTVENGGAFFAGVGDERHLVVKYKLRRGIKWSDGVEVTVADMLYYYKLMLDPNASVARRSLQLKVGRVVAPGSHTAVVHFLSYAGALEVNRSADELRKIVLKPYLDDKRPVTDPAYSLVLDALPDHVLSKIPADKIGSSDYTLQPVGTGPFMVESKDWQWGNSITLVRNPNYNLTAPPLLDRIVFRLGVSGPEQAVDELRSGRVDAVSQDVFYTPNALLASLNDKDLVVEAAPGPVWEHIDFNLDKPGLSDRIVRQAMAYAIDRQRIVDEVWMGKGEVLHTFLPSVSWASMQRPELAAAWESKFPLHRYDYDPARANEMLDRAGWARGEEGIRVKGGVRLAFAYAIVAGNRTRESIYNLVAADLAAIGVEIRAQYVPSEAYLPDPTSLPYRTHTFDMYEYAGLLGSDPSGQEYESWNVPTLANGEVGENFPGYRNPQFDALSQAASKEIDRTKRAPMFAEMQSIWTEDLPALPLYARANIEVHKASLVGWETSGGDTPATYRAAAMYFK